MLPDNQYPAKTNKKLLPRMSILILFFLVLLGALGYVYYFNPAFLAKINSFNNQNNESLENKNNSSLAVGGR